MPAKGTVRNLLMACFLIVAAIAAALAAFLGTSSRKNNNESNASLRASSPVPTAMPVAPAPPGSDTNFTAQNGAPSSPYNPSFPTGSPPPEPNNPPTMAPSTAPSTNTPSTPSPTTGSPVQLPTTQTPTTEVPTTGAPIVSTTAPVQSAPTEPPVTFPPTMVATESAPFDAPTLPPVAVPIFDEDGTKFRLKMYWQEGYFWQEETRERFWCVECTKCDKLNFNDNGEGCDFAWECEAGHQLWLHGCRNGYGHVFQAKTVGDYHQIRVHDSNLCLERTQKRYLTVQNCNDGNDAQWWHKIRADGGPFELRPANGSRDDEPFCVTQQHHPKPSEILGLKECRQAHRWETGYWNAFRLYSGNN